MNIRYRRLTKARITGRVEEMDAMFDFCRRNGYDIICAGPLRISRRKRLVDVKRFAITAQRVESTKG